MIQAHALKLQHNVKQNFIPNAQTVGTESILHIKHIPLVHHDQYVHSCSKCLLLLLIHIRSISHIILISCLNYFLIFF